jgi:prevent-host-death family protein
MNSNQKGLIAETAIAAEAARLGIGVARPFADERYDLIFDLRPKLLRVQCKWARRTNDVLIVHIGGSWHSPGRGYVRSTYTADEIDAVGVYSEDLDACYLLPIEVVTGQGHLYLRLSPTNNNQSAGVNFASQYELGAIAQLGERLAGSQEVEGSSPSSSIPLKDTVGMDEFDSKLAHYVRHAEAGNEVLVTRWGRPVAKLGPPT